MIGNKYILGAVLAAAPLAALAQTISVYTFDSISSIDYRDPAAITGILVNETTPTTLILPPGNSAQCPRFFELMLTEPGKYILTVATSVEQGSGGTYEFLRGCKLERKP